LAPYGEYWHHPTMVNDLKPKPILRILVVLIIRLIVPVSLGTGMARFHHRLSNAFTIHFIQTPSAAYTSYFKPF